VCSIANTKSFEMVRAIHDKLDNFLASPNFPKARRSAAAAAAAVRGALRYVALRAARCGGCAAA
jgi:hypothetical protein